MRFESCPDLAFRPEDEIEQRQRQLLQEHLHYCLEHSPYYRARYHRLGITVNGIGTEGLRDLPLTCKEDLGNANDAFCAVPMSEIVDIVLSSGTTGTPTRIMYTERDLERLAYNERQAFASLGMCASDIVLLTCTLDRCFIAGLAYFLGVRRLGAAAIRNGHGTMESHLCAIEKLKPTIIIGVPTFLRKLGVYLAERGIAPAETSVSKLICIGEPIRSADLTRVKLGADLETLWGAAAYSTYATSEIVSTFCECSAQQGGHLQPDLAVVEIVDDHGRVVPPGACGEVVVTPLGVEGMPLVRFKTGDVSFLIDAPCSCGRKSPRLGPIVGRKSQMMKVCGTTLYPESVYAALDRIEGIQEYYVTVSRYDELSDRVCVTVAVSDDLPVGGVAVRDVICERLQAFLRVTPEVMIASEAAVRSVVYTPASRKPVRFLDRR